MVNNKEYENIVEEITDVEIMLAQLKIFLRCENEVIKVSDQKLVRLIERMNSK
ncbi:hypothetical protein [Anaerosporobacter sp.]